LKVAPQAKVAPQDSLDEISQLADQGRLQEAMRRCEDAMRVAPSARVFYLMGLIHDANGNLTEAEQYYRKALYLEPGHHEAIIHLAFLKEQQGDLAGARQLHQRAKRVGARG
jgi:chemotaxis protein methyltransferase WspC